MDKLSRIASFFFFFSDIFAIGCVFRADWIVTSVGGKKKHLTFRKE